jgi:hypothetical protein
MSVVSWVREFMTGGNYNIYSSKGMSLEMTCLSVSIAGGIGVGTSQQPSQYIGYLSSQVKSEHVRRHIQSHHRIRLGRVPSTAMLLAVVTCLL